MAKLKMTWIKEKKAPLFVASGLCLVLAAGLGTGLWLASERKRRSHTGKCRQNTESLRLGWRKAAM